ncbi:MAG: hypothetical protein O3A20_04790, partial [Planctomycetota bacterium]|nr:hypothetical protein [Planctomycetota bacterium]
MSCLISLVVLALAQSQPVREPQRLDVGAAAAASIAGDAAGGLHAVAWSAGANGIDGVWCAISGDGGRTWAPPVRVDSGGSATARSVQEGSVEVVAGEI